MADSAPKQTKHAGDSSSWESTFSDYPANASWVAVCTFQKPGESPLKLEATASGTKHAFTFSAADSATLASGRWTWAIRVSKDATTKVTQTGEIEIKPNPEATPTPSHYEKCLSLIKAALEERFEDVQDSVAILGQDITKVPASELERLLHRYQALVNNERRLAYQLATGTRRRVGRIYLT